MNVSSMLDRLHAQAKSNRWLWLFSIFNRVALAAGFIPAGIVKIMDERFASGLHPKHPMGYYLEALHYSTGYYYTFIGVAQIAAAVMLLIPRTVTLGAFFYFPIILNIWILTYATRFDGSFFTAPLMTMANLYLLGWNYEKWKYILPFNRLPAEQSFENSFQTGENSHWRRVFNRGGISWIYERFRIFVGQLIKDKFPWLFFAGVFATIVFFMIVVPNILYGIKPRNTLPQCLKQFNNSTKTKAGAVFCDCIHQNGEPLNKCITDFYTAPDDAVTVATP